MAHAVSIEVGGVALTDFTEYSIENDMLSPADDFQLTVGPATREIFDALQPDAEVKVRIDGVLILTGRIDQRNRRKSRDVGSVITVNGRDKGGRLVDESMPLASFSGMSLQALLEKVAGPWFDEVIFSNARNRALVRGPRAVLARASADPETPEEVAALKAFMDRYGTRARSLDGELVVYGAPRAADGIFEASKAPKKVEPGETRWDVMMQFLEPARFLAWSTADGKALVIGGPNYKQDPQFQFFLPRDPQSLRRGFANVTDWDWTDSVADRYSEVIVMGASRGDGARYGSELNSMASAKDGPGADGVGRDFLIRKKLIVADDDVKNRADAQARANREIARRDQTRRVLKVQVDGHGQKYNAQSDPAIYAFDCVAEAYDEELDLGGRFLVVSVSFNGSKSSGQTTSLTLVPVGTELSL